MGALEFAVIAVAVERELTRLGWTVARGNARSEQVAMVRSSQGTRAPRRAAPASASASAAAPAAIAAASASAVGATIPVGGSGPIVIDRACGPHPAPLRRDRLLGGPGELEARAARPLASRAAAADRLAAALFQDFPGESGRTIRVR